MNAIHCPSGDQTGRTSHAREPTSLVAFPPATGTVYRSPNRSKTNVLPSGEISRLISVASVVVKVRSEEHTSELQSLMRISYAVFCLKNKKNTKQCITNNYHTSIHQAIVLGS